jgi:hypothetical protein
MDWDAQEGAIGEINNGIARLRGRLSHAAAISRCLRQRIGDLSLFLEFADSKAFVKQLGISSRIQVEKYGRHGRGEREGFEGFYSSSTEAFS